MSTPGALSIVGVGSAITPAAAQPVQDFALPAMPMTGREFIAKVFDRNLNFKRTLGSAATAVPGLLNRPNLKLTQNGGYQQITLELAASPPGVNMIPDPGFELSNSLADVQLNWWLNTPSVWTLMTDPTAGDTRRGMRAIKATRVVTTPSTWEPAEPIIPPALTIGPTSRLFPLIPGQTYSFSVWSKQNAGTQNSHVKITWTDQNGNGISNFQPMGGQSGVKPWTFYSGLWTAPPGAYYAVIDLMAGWWDGVTGTNAQTWYDDVRFTLGTDPLEGIDLGDVIRLQDNPEAIISNLSEDFEKIDPLDTSVAAGWQHYNVGTGTSNLFNNNSHSGANAIQLTNPSNGNFGGLGFKQGLVVPADAKILWITLWAKGSSAFTTGPVRVTFANPGGQIDSRGYARAQPSGEFSVSPSDRNIVLTTSYQQFSFSVPVPVGFKFAFVEIYANAGPGTGTIFYLDDVNMWIETNSGSEYIFSGNVETMPDPQAPGATKHQIVVSPWVTELGDGYFNQTYAVPTDVAQWVRDAVATTAHCSVTPVSVPNTGILAVYDFQNTTPLDVLHVAKQRAGAFYFYFVDAQGIVWFQAVNPSNPATVTLKKGTDYSTRAPTRTTQGMHNRIPVIGGQNPGDTGRLKSLYDNPASQAKYGVKSYNPTLSFPTVTDQGTLDGIANALGSLYDRVLHTDTIDCPALGYRLTPNRPGGVTVRTWEQAVEPMIESGEPGSGTYGPTLILQDVEVVGPSQKLTLGDVPFTDIDPAFEAARVAQRIGVVASPAVATPAVAPQPAPPTTKIYGPARPTAGIKPEGGGTVTIATFTFTIPQAGTCQVVASVDARMEAWDNYVSAPRRALRATLSGAIFTGAWQELPFGLTRAVYDLSSAAGLSIPAGTYTATIDMITIEFNQMHIYSGYVQVAVTS